MSDEILTMREVAELLKINEKTAYKLAAEGKLPGFRVGGAWRFKKSTINAWIDAQTNVTDAARKSSLS
jgi:excisionase family DNA binding protein